MRIPLPRRFFRLPAIVLAVAASAIGATPVPAQESAGDTLRMQPLKLPRLPVAPLIQSQQQPTTTSSAAEGTRVLLDQVEGFLRLDGVPGTATSRAYRGWIMVLGYDAEIAGGSASSSGHSTGRARAGPVTLTKPLDAASVPLRRLAAAGQRLPRAEIALVTAGNHLELYRATLVNVGVAAVHTRMQEGVVTEQVDLDFDRMMWQFRLVDERNQVAGIETGCWDFVGNRPC